MVDKRKNRWLELGRFLVCGLAAALTDYLIAQLFVFFLHSVLDEIWTTIISTAIGFVFGAMVNYLISTYWVYQNVDRGIDTKSKRFIIFFFLFTLCAMLLSIETMLICNLVVISNWGNDYNIVHLSVMELIKNNGWKFLSMFIFWAYFISFCIKTLVGLVFNYFTRKYILYKEPKEKKEQDEK